MNGYFFVSVFSRLSGRYINFFGKSKSRKIWYGAFYTFCICLFSSPFFFSENKEKKVFKLFYIDVPLVCVPSACTHFWLFTLNYIDNIDNNDSFNIINFLILSDKHFKNRSRNNEESFYFVTLLTLLKDKIKNVIYIKQINNQYVKDWERDLADAL